MGLSLCRERVQGVDCSLGSGLHRLEGYSQPGAAQQGLEKGERGLRALILVRAVGMQTILTTACRRVVDGNAQVVAPENHSKARRASLRQRLSPVIR